MLESVQPDVHLVGTLLALNRAIPERSRETARALIRKVVDELERRLAQPTRQAVSGALDRATRTSRPRPGDIDWNRTILANLRHYQPEHGTIVPERLVGTAGACHRSAARSSCASTRAGRWRRRWSTPACSGPCSRRCDR